MSFTETLLNPVEQVQRLIIKAFSNKSQQRRRLHRGLQQALKLASIRGYQHTKALVDHFSCKTQTEKFSKRMITTLLSYVSYTEFMQMVSI